MLKCDYCGKEYEEFRYLCDCGAEIKQQKDMSSWSKLSREEQKNLYHRIKRKVNAQNSKSTMAIFFLIALVISIFFIIISVFGSYNDPVGAIFGTIFNSIFLIIFGILFIFNLIMFIIFTRDAVSSNRAKVKNGFPDFLLQNNVYFDLKTEYLDEIIDDLRKRE